MVVGKVTRLGRLPRFTVVTTAIHHFVNTSGIKYAVLGQIEYTSYSGGIFYDIHPIKATC